MTHDPTDYRTKLTRRRLLSGIGAFTAALTSPIWRVSTAFGQTPKVAAARRFIGVFSANGTIASEFFPGCSNLLATSPNSCPTAPPDSPLTVASLGRILQPLAAHVSQMLVLKGVDMISTVSNQLGTMTSKPGGPHMKGPGAMLTGGSLLPGSFQGAGGPAGYADRISVDQFIANRIGTTTAFKSLEFGVRVIGGEPLNTISYSGANQPNVPIYDPVQMYSRMFANANLSSTQLTQLLSERKSVLDFLQSDIGALEPRLSSNDQARLDAHLTGIRSIEQQLSSSASACATPKAPPMLDPNDMANFPAIGKLQMDMMLLAHSCGMTHVSTFMWANADSWQYYPFAGVNEEHHGTSHCSDTDSVNVENLVLINIWQAQQVTYLLDQLAATLESDGSTMLDNTVLLWGNELGVGNTHDYKNIPWMLAGGAGGYLKTGRYLQFPDVPHNNLLVSICNAMGFSDVTSFGIPGVCTGPLAGLAA
jgi:uncharacterized protein DUF1552